MQSARQDIKTVESWGYTPAEALEFVARRAVSEARRVADQSAIAPDRDVLEQQLAYLAELRAICLAASRRQRRRVARHA